MHLIRHEYSLILLVRRIKTTRINSNQFQSKHSKARVTAAHYTAGVHSPNGRRRASDHTEKRKENIDCLIFNCRKVIISAWCIREILHLIIYVIRL